MRDHKDLENINGSGLVVEDKVTGTTIEVVVVLIIIEVEVAAEVLKDLDNIDKSTTLAQNQNSFQEEIISMHLIL